jgi:hypothetical protein
MAMQTTALVLHNAAFYPCRRTGMQQRRYVSITLVYGFLSMKLALDLQETAERVLRGTDYSIW